jgi:hypothetical protein
MLKWLIFIGLGNKELSEKKGVTIMIVLGGHEGCGLIRMTYSLSFIQRLRPITTYTTKEASTGNTKNILRKLEPEEFQERKKNGFFCITTMDKNRNHAYYTGIASKDKYDMGVNRVVLGRGEFIDTFYEGTGLREKNDFFLVFLDVPEEIIAYKVFQHKGYEFVDTFDCIDDVNQILAREANEVAKMRERADLIIRSPDMSFQFHDVHGFIYERYMEFLKRGRRHWKRETKECTRDYF